MYASRSSPLPGGAPCSNTSSIQSIGSSVVRNSMDSGRSASDLVWSACTTLAWPTESSPSARVRLSAGIAFGSPAASTRVQNSSVCPCSWLSLATVSCWSLESICSTGSVPSRSPSDDGLPSGAGSSALAALSRLSVASSPSSRSDKARGTKFTSIDFLISVISSRVGRSSRLLWSSGNPCRNQP